MSSGAAFMSSQSYFPFLPPTPQTYTLVATDPAVFLEASHCLYWVLLRWVGQGGKFMISHLPSYTLGPTVRAAAPLFHQYLACWSCSGQQTTSVATVPVLPCPTYPTHSNAPTLRCPNVWIFQACLCVELGIL